MLGFSSTHVSPIHSKAFQEALRKSGNGEATLNRLILDNFDAVKPGWKLDDINNSLYQVFSTKPINTTLGKQLLYLYSDVCDYSYVGDTMEQLLRVVAIKGQPFEVVTERFDSPHYVPVLHSHIQSINVTIGNEVGENAPFQTGKTLVKLHFRPARNY